MVLCLLLKLVFWDDTSVKTILRKTSLSESLRVLRHAPSSPTLADRMRTFFTLPPKVAMSTLTVFSFRPWSAWMRSVYSSGRSSQQREALMMNLSLRAPYLSHSTVTSSISVGMVKLLPISNAFLFSSFTWSITLPSKVALSSYIIRKNQCL